MIHRSHQLQRFIPSLDDALRARAGFSESGIVMAVWGWLFDDSLRARATSDSDSSQKRTSGKGQEKTDKRSAREI